MRRTNNFRESQLNRMIAESVRKVINESDFAAGYNGNMVFDLDKSDDGDEETVFHNNGKFAVGKNHVPYGKGNGVKRRVYDLRKSVDEAVNEAMMDEDVKSAVNAIGSRVNNFLSRRRQNLQKQAKGAYDGAVERVKGAYNGAVERAKGAYNNAAEMAKGAYDATTDYLGDKKDQIQQGYQSLKTTGRAGSINGDAQKYLKTACDSLNNLINANQRLIDSGMNPVFSKPQVNYIRSVYKALSNKYSQAFTDMRNNYVNPSGQQQM